MEIGETHFYQCPIGILRLCAIVCKEFIETLIDTNLNCHYQGALVGKMVVDSRGSNTDFFGKRAERNHLAFTMSRSSTDPAMIGMRPAIVNFAQALMRVVILKLLDHQGLIAPILLFSLVELTRHFTNFGGQCNTRC